MNLQKEINVKNDLLENNVSLIYNEFLKLKTLKNIELSENGSLILKFYYNGKIQIKNETNDEIEKIIAKIDKYNSKKMSEKEIEKMLKKIDTDLELSVIIQKMKNKETLINSDISLLEKKSKKQIFYIDYSLIKLLNEDFEIVEIDYQSVLPETEMQEELEAQYKIEKELHTQEQLQKLNKVLTVSKNEEKRKLSVREYQNEILAKGLNIAGIDVLAPFPQANDLNRVLEIGMDMFNDQAKSLDKVLLLDEYHARDISYYVASLKYLNLIYVSDKEFCLTNQGLNFFSLDISEQKIKILELISEDPIIKMILEKNTNTEDFTNLCQLRGMDSIETVKRRMSCINSWISFINS